MADVKNQIEQLRGRIRKHDRLYYVLHKPEISDREYDRLFAELKCLEEANPELITLQSPTQRVSGEPSTGLKTVPTSSSPRRSRASETAK